LSIEAALPNILTYHLNGLPFEEGAECIVSESEYEFIITCGDDNASIKKRTIVDIYIEEGTKRVKTDQVSPLKTILYTIFVSGWAMFYDGKPQKKTEKYDFENLVIISKTVGGTEEISLRLSVESWEVAEDMVRNFNHKKDY
jgi:hypothetical protein